MLPERGAAPEVYYRFSQPRFLTEKPFTPTLTRRSRYFGHDILDMLEAFCAFIIGTSWVLMGFPHGKRNILVTITVISQSHLLRFLTSAD